VGFNVREQSIARVRAVNKDGANVKFSWAVPIRINGDILYLSTLHGVTDSEKIRLENLAGSDAVSATIVFRGSNDPHREDLALLKPDRPLTTTVAKAEDISSNEQIKKLLESSQYKVIYAADPGKKDVSLGLAMGAY